MEFRFAILECDMTDGFLGTEARRRPEMVAQFSLDQRHAPAYRVTEHRFAGTVWADNCPLFASAKLPIQMLENNAVAEPERSVAK